MYIYDRPLSWQRSMKRRETIPLRYRGSSLGIRWSPLCGLDDPPKRAGTLVLYVRPTDAKDGKLAWSFDTSEGRGEYEKALHKHLAAKKIVPAKGTTYEPMTSSADIATLASDKFEKLVLIVHSAGNGPAIGVNLSGNGDWLKDDAVATVLAPLAYSNVTILGCDAVENKFAPSLATRLPKGSTVVGHKGGAFVIDRHFEKSKTIRGRMVLTRVTSNFNLKTFKAGN
jgi:hypothetical protein